MRMIQAGWAKALLAASLGVSMAAGGVSAWAAPGGVARASDGAAWAVAPAVAAPMAMAMAMGEAEPEPAVAKDLPTPSSGPAPAEPGATVESPDCPPAPAPLLAEEVVSAMREATDNGFLWKVTKGGHSTWLFGTIHVAQRAWMFPGPHVLQAIMASDTVVLELDETDPKTMARLLHAAAPRPGATPLPAALESRLRARMVAECIDPQRLDGLRPEMRAVTVAVMAGRRVGLDPTYGVDLFLAGMSRGMKKPIRALETPESQLALLVSDDPRETENSVAEVLDEIESGQGLTILERLADDWRRGNFDDLNAYTDWCECLTTPAQRTQLTRLLDDRNPLMADQVAKWHGEGRSMFVAVGSLHMIGPKGLPALLRAKGFEVERVDYEQ